jgi:Fe-S oxidoreductase
MAKNWETVAPFKEAEAEIEEAGGAETSSLCYQCGKCDVVCPWNRVRSFSIRRIVRETMLGLPEIEDEDIWRCTTCGNCPSHCPRGVKQIDVGVSVRRVASEYGVFPEAVRPVRGARGSLADDGNPLNYDREDRAGWAEGRGVEPFSEGMELLYFVGCYLSYDPRLKKVAVATANLLQKAGVEFGILGSRESCCGESIRKTGDEALFRSLARDNIKTFVDHGVKRILVSSPHCYHTFKNEYPEFMVHFEVVHITELLAELVADGRLTLPGEYAQRVTYHDPCYLGRHNGIYDAPRELLRGVPGLELVEMTDHHQASLCCGGGGGRIWMDTPKKERFSDLRFQQAEAAGAQVLATACPYCITNFEESRLDVEDEADALVIKDITEILDDVTGGAR